jgi:hypothetical protein
MSYFSHIKQEVVADAGNSSTTNLTVGNTYTFTGIGASTLGVAGIQVTLKTDKNCTVKVQQSPDNTNWDIIDTYTYYYSLGGQSWTVQAVNSYVRIVVTTASETTSYFRLQTALCPIVEALPRSLSSRGWLVTKVGAIEDEYGFEVENTPMGEMRTVIPTRLVGTNFEGTAVDALFWTATVTNSGTVVQANAQVTLSTTTTNQNGAAVLASFRRARYVSGNSMAFRTIVTLSAGAVNNRRRWGMAWGTTMPTISDGAYFQLSGTTFSVVTLKTGTPTAVDSGSFNGSLGATFDPSTTVKTYEIYWTNSKVYFIVGGLVLHTVSADTTTWADTMNFHIFMDNVNFNALQTNHTLVCRVASIRRLGPLLSQPTSYYFASGTTAGFNLKLGPGNLHSIIVNNTANNSVIILADSTANATPIIFTHTAGATSTAAYALDFKGLPFYIGLRLIVSSANSSLTIIYE